jgi:hypothetical protein
VKPCTLLLAVCPLAAAEGTLRQPLPVTDDLTVVATLAPALRSGSISDVDDSLSPRYDLELDGDSSPSAGVTARWTRGWWDGDGWGWLAGIEGGALSAAGELVPEDGGSEQELTVRAFAAGPAAGIGWRADLGGLELPGDALESHLLVHLKGGVGQARIDGSGTGEGAVFGGGASWGLWWTGWHRWKIGAEVGVEWLRLDGVSWSNTGDAEFTFSGPVAGIGAGWRF